MTVDTVERNASQSGEVAERRHALELPGVNSRLQQFARDGAAAMTIAKSLAGTSFVPTSYKKSRRRGSDGRWTDVWFEPEAVAYNVTAAWLAGDEIGLKPMQALQAINIIEGTPALSAQSMRALVQSHGHEVWVSEQSPPTAAQSDIYATVRGLRKGSTREPVEVTWTWKRARQAGLVEKDNWTKDALAMCIARASSAVCRLIAADVLMGLAYSSEELGDELEGLSAEQVAAPAPRGRLQRRQPGQDSRSALPAGTEPQGPVTTPERGVEPREETPEEGSQPSRQETPESPAVPSTHNPDGSLKAGETAVQEGADGRLEQVCGHAKPDGSSLCSRPVGHEGRHHFGREKPREHLEAVERAAQESNARVDERGPQGPDVEERRPAPERHRFPEEPTGPAVAEFVPTPEEVAAANEGGDGELSYPEPSEEELERAYLEEQAARSQEARAERETARAQERRPAVDPNPPEVGGRPVQDTALPDGGEDDDPWAAFR